MATTHHRPPTGRTERGLNRVVGWLSSHGIGLAGARTLIVAGRRSGQPRAVVVNPLTLDGRRYLVSPRGETEWVRNARAAGEGVLSHGRHREPIRLTEVPETGRAPILRAYLDNWGWEVGRLLPEGLSVNADEAQLAARAHLLPVFVAEDADEPVLRSQ